jgi:imidazolonepropionase
MSPLDSTQAAPSDRIWDRIWLNADLATMTGDGIGHIGNAALAIAAGRIAWLGPMSDLASLPNWSAVERTEARGLWITPGLVECHTHLVYAGDRADEFDARLRGATYEEIARAGGGILSTMRATRAATDEQLLTASLPRAAALAAEGVTTLEVKSGYGLTLDAELKMLRVARALGERLGITIVTTFLGAHAVPPEFTGRADDYVRLICDEMLPAVAKAGLADAVDAFCERIAFSRAQTTAVFERARELGLPLRLHADQLSDGAGGALAATFGALSADHLEYASTTSLEQMAARGVVAGLLPGACFFLREKHLPPIAQLRALGIPMAVSTDCNPGTSPLASLLTAMNMACVLFGLTPTEALRGATLNAARALGRDDRGSLAIGQRADLAIWRLRHPQQLCNEVGVHRPVDTLVAGTRRVSN